MATQSNKTRLSVKVVPGASRSEIVGWLGEALKVRVSKPPEKGKANRAVEALISDALGMPAGSAQVVAGAASSRKILEIDGLSPTEVRDRLPRR
jgi:uncharacterized protein (TIGR00251 family)